MGKSRLPLPTLEKASRKKIWSRSSLPSSAPSREGQDWVFPLPPTSSRSIGGLSALKVIPIWDRPFGSVYPRFLPLRRYCWKRRASKNSPLTKEEDHGPFEQSRGYDGRTPGD